MIKLFSQPLASVPTVWIDTETTGKVPGRDRVVSVAFVRFDGGVPVAHFSSLVNPGVPIPAETTAIHGIVDEMVKDAPAVADVMASEEVARIVKDAQPGAYNAPFDKGMLPPFADDWSWPWLDAMTLVRAVDRFVKGKGRHKLDVSCARHGIELVGAHGALADATAAGRLFYKLVPSAPWPKGITLGDALHWQRVVEASNWHNFMGWLAKQPPLPTAAEVSAEAEALAHEKGSDQCR